MVLQSKLVTELSYPSTAKSYIRSVARLMLLDDDNHNDDDCDVADDSHCQ